MDVAELLCRWRLPMVQPQADPALKAGVCCLGTQSAARTKDKSSRQTQIKHYLCIRKPQFTHPNKRFLPGEPLGRGLNQL